MNFTKDFGIVEPTVLQKDDNLLILYNRFTTKKVFTTKEQLSGIDKEVMKELRDGKVVIKIPSLNRFRIETTFRCNGGCDYCLVYNNPIRSQGEDMRVEISKVINNRFNSEVELGSIMLIGGEPLMNMPVVRDFIDNSKGYILVFTNGTLIDDSVAKLLSKPHVSTFVSVDGRERDNFHRKTKEGFPMYKDSLKGYLKLKDKGANTGISCLVTNDNVDSLEEIVHFFHENLGESIFGLSTPHRTRQNAFAVDMEKYTAHMISLFHYSQDSGIYIAQVANILQPLVMSTPRLSACKIVGEQVTFYPDGSQTLCAKLDTLEEYKSLTAQELREKMPLSTGECHECNSIGICGGGCIWDAALDRSGNDINTCTFVQSMLEPLLWNMYRDAPKNVIVRPGHLPKHVSMTRP
jgi:radical SAM protein with 4Fe4S-binding SPASM domain